MSTMKAILISDFVNDPSTLRPVSVPIPQPKQGQYLVRITVCSPQHADILHAQGKHQNNNRKRGWCFPPFILGYDFAGEVVSGPHDASPSSGAFRKGERVFGAALGAFAEYICVDEGAVRRIPKRLSTETACAMSGQAVSYAAAVHIAKVKNGEVVMVSGASGGLGSVCCMVAKAKGAKVIALTGDADKAESIKQTIGADLVVQTEGDWIKRVIDFTNGKGVNVVLDNTGMVDDAIRCIAYFGRVVILGFAARNGVMEEVKMNKLLLKSVTVTGYRFGESGRRYPKELQRIWNGYMKMLETGQLKAPLHGRYEGLNDVGRALQDLENRKVCGKIVVNVETNRDAAKL